MIEGLDSIEDAQAVVSWLEGKISRRKTELDNIMATGQHSAGVKPQAVIEAFEQLKYEALSRIAELDAEIEGYIEKGETE